MRREDEERHTPAKLGRSEREEVFSVMIRDREPKCLYSLGMTVIKVCVARTLGSEQVNQQTLL